MDNSGAAANDAPPADVRRTFVVSDVHGYPEVIQNALEHGGFDPARDRLVLAGDVVDRGGRVEECFELLDSYPGTNLLGNHDLAILVGYPIPDQDPANREFRDRLRVLYLDGEPGRRWEVVASVEGVMISHAGVTAAYDPLLTEACGGDPAALAALLNDQAREAIRHELATGSWDEKGILGRCGPLRFRRFECPGARLPSHSWSVVVLTGPSRSSR